MYPDPTFSDLLCSDLISPRFRYNSVKLHIPGDVGFMWPVLKSILAGKEREEWEVQQRPRKKWGKILRF